MSDPTSETHAPPLRNPWPRAVATITVAGMLVGGAVFVAREAVHAPGEVLQKMREMLGRGGAQLRNVAEAFQQGTVRTEFLSSATEIAGMSRYQFATLKQAESFKREESGTTAWGWVPLPKVVVQAVAPVEYGYSLDFDAPWEFLRDGETVIVFPPPIIPGTPAIDVSALTFYTLEGSIWRDEHAVEEKLRQSLTDSLKVRAAQNVQLVREVGRVRLAAFVEKWLAEKFSDGASFHVKVVFPDERVSAHESKTL